MTPVGPNQKVRRDVSVPAIIPFSDHLQSVLQTILILILIPPLYPTPKNMYILNQSQVGLSQEKRKKTHGGHVFCFQKQQR